MINRKRLRVLLYVFGVVFGGASGAEADSSCLPGVSALRDFEIMRSVRARPRRAVRPGAEATEPIELYIRVAGERMKLQLTPADIFSDDCTVVEDTPSGPVERPCDRYLYFGSVVGESFSRARVYVENGLIDARIEVPGEVYWIEPVDRYLRHANSHQMIIYAESKLVVE